MSPAAPSRHGGRVVIGLPPPTSTRPVRPPLPIVLTTLCLYLGAMMARRFARSFGSLAAIFEFIRDYLASQGLDEHHACDLDLVVEELYTNMVKYGGDTVADVAMELDWRAPTIIVRLRDFDVDAFDPRQAPEVDPNRPIEQRRSGGLGIHFVRQIADRIDYKQPDRRSTITVTKRLTS